MNYSTPFSDSTISNLLIFRENIRFTRIDNAKVITNVMRKFTGDIDGNM